MHRFGTVVGYPARQGIQAIAGQNIAHLMGIEAGDTVGLRLCQQTMGQRGIGRQTGRQGRGLHQLPLVAPVFNHVHEGGDCPFGVR